MNRFTTTLVLAVAAMLVLPAYGEDLSYDFGSTSELSGGNVNEVTPLAQNVDDSIRLSDGSSTTVDLTITSLPPLNSTFAGFATAPNTAGTTAPVPVASNFFGAQATRDSLFGFTGIFQGNNPRPTVEYLVSGLNAGGSYDFTFFGSRTATDNRETRYDVDGTFDEINVASNTANVAQVLGAVANGSGELTLTISPGDDNNNSLGFYYLGAMQISGEFTSIPEPASLTLLALAGLCTLGMRRRQG